MIWKDWVEEEKVFFHGTVIEIKSSMEARKAGWIKTGKKTGIVLLLEVHETGKQVVKRRANVFRDRDA